MLKTALFCMLSLFTVPAAAGPADDAATVVTTTLDKFNAGDIDAFFAAHEDGALIVDEFAPYVWGGPNSAQRWAADYMKDAAKRGIAGGHMDHAAAIQASSDGSSAYIVVPTTYRFAEHGRKMAARGSMTFVMARRDAGWKIASWTYAGEKPVPE
ncbi:MAG: nuclear transport factor 2 family protein [Sphingomicrobium sp.]